MTNGGLVAALGRDSVGNTKEGFMKLLGILMSILVASHAMAASQRGDVLVKIASKNQIAAMNLLQANLPRGSQLDDLGLAGWVRVQIPEKAVSTFNKADLFNIPGVVHVEENKVIKLLEDYQVRDEALRAQLFVRMLDGNIPMAPATADNPDIPSKGSGGSGADPLYNKQWGMNQMKVRESWSKTSGDPKVVVAVIDTGVDYTHEDLVDNMWRNPGETGVDANGKDKATNGIDDDGNGFIDDVVGWDFAGNDNKPYDLTASLFDMIISGGNPGHGTHCAGNVAARGNNGKGVSGVAPNVKIMALRFITEKGQGTTSDAIKSIKYAIQNGAKVMSNSWGSEGDDPQDSDSQALKDTIQYAQDKGVLFIAAAGNGHQGKGYDNDTDAKPGFPASYSHDIIISVAAIDEAGNLGSFSNWGAKSVDIGAPGVKVFSTVTQDVKYTDTVIDIPGLLTATWDGTSMATPHVAGAAALYISAHPEANWRDVKSALLNSVKRTGVLNGKVVSGGQLDVGKLMEN